MQRQIRSEIAGVAFSLDPITNDYDEVVVDANWGLGESVVAGSAAPDHFVIDKVSGTLVEKRLGAKEISVWLDADGGTVARHGYRAAQKTLGGVELGELVRVLCRVEGLYGRPMDMSAALAEPFSVYQVDMQRRFTRITVTALYSEEEAVRQLETLEPWVWWTGPFLAERARLYTATAHPLAAKAQAQLDSYLRYDTTALDTPLSYTP